MGYTFLLDNTPYTTSLPLSAIILTDGLYTWTVRALDWKGDSTGYTGTWDLRVDTVPPQVVATSPFSGEQDVPVEAGVVVTFSEPVVAASFGYTVSPDPGGWAAAWNGAGDVVTLTHTPFVHVTAYNVSVLSANDRAGNPLLEAPVEWPFTTRPLFCHLPLVPIKYGRYFIYLPMMQWASPWAASLPANFR